MPVQTMVESVKTYIFIGHRILQLTINVVNDNAKTFSPRVVEQNRVFN